MKPLPRTLLRPFPAPTPAFIVCAFAALLFTLAGCAAPLPSGRLEISADRPLIWEVAAGRWVRESDLVSRLSAAKLRLLGEIHDNPEHHRIRAQLVRKIATAGRRPAIAFEQFDLEQGADLIAIQRPGALPRPDLKVDLDTILTVTKMDRRGWQWPMHQPLVEAALDAGLPLRAANPERVELMRAARAPVGTVPEARWGARYAAVTWTPAQDALLREDIIEAHCRKLPERAVAPIARAQRMRDAAMAQALVEAAGPDGAILIAGNGHVRRDVGVPVYLRSAGQAGADLPLVSVGFLETEPADLAKPDFPRGFLADRPGYDIVWFTATALREDPCEQMPGPAQPATK